MTGSSVLELLGWREARVLGGGGGGLVGGGRKGGADDGEWGGGEWGRACLGAHINAVSRW